MWGKRRKESKDEVPPKLIKRAESAVTEILLDPKEIGARSLLKAQFLYLTAESGLTLTCDNGGDVVVSEGSTEEHLKGAICATIRDRVCTACCRGGGTLSSADRSGKWSAESGNVIAGNDLQLALLEHPSGKIIAQALAEIIAHPVEKREEKSLLADISIATTEMRECQVLNLNPLRVAIPQKVEKVTVVDFLYSCIRQRRTQLDFDDTAEKTVPA
jgi:hypothetical protein